MKLKKTILKRSLLILSICLIFSISFIYVHINRLHNNLKNPNFITQNYCFDNLESSQITWNITWGGNLDDWARDIAIDNLNNIYLVGGTHSFGNGNEDVLVIKYNSLKEQQWNITWGGSEDDFARGITIDVAGNLYLTGDTQSFGEGNEDTFLAKFNSSGDLQWNTTWGSSGIDHGTAVAIDEEGKIYVTGVKYTGGPSTGQLFLLQFNSSGDLQWTEIWGGSEDERGYDVLVKDSNTVYVIGVQFTNGGIDGDAIIAEYNNSGDQQWIKYWGGSVHDIAFGGALDSEGNIYITGRTESYSSGGQDVFLAQYNSSGDFQWDSIWGGDENDEARDIVLDETGTTIYLTGFTHSFGAGNLDVFLASFNNIGDLQGNETWGGAFDDWGFGLAIDNSNQVFLTGMTESFGAGNRDIFLVEYNFNNITLITPENTTYTGGMTGYFPGTYSFENDENGLVNAKGWIGKDEPNLLSQIIEEKDGHKKVYHLYDNDDNQYTQIANNFSESQPNGTIEFWWYRDNFNYGGFIYLYSDSEQLVRINPSSTVVPNWHYFNENPIQEQHDLNISYFPANEWIHVRLDFETTGGNYLNLSDDTFRLTINGQFSDTGLLNETTEGVAQIRLCTRWGEVGAHNFWVDAVGYSWDSNYNVENNLNEGLLLGYTNTTELEWSGYSLDGQPNITINGNTTIRMPEDGPHTIQIFGNDSLGNDYSSAIRYFTIEETQEPTNITIETPENISYMEPMAGYYAATYGFENDELGTIPEGWTLTNGLGGTAQIISSNGGHNNILELHDDSQPQLELENNFAPQTSGTIEWYTKFSSTSDDFNIHLQSGSSTHILIGFNHGDIQYNNGSWQSILPYSTTEWYHFRLEFNSTAESYDLYVNTQLELNDESYLNTPGGSIDTFYMETGFPDSNYYLYFDAFGFSWDENYEVGDNLNEGLLLSYTNTTELGWMGYSLDGQANITINGNTTIPFPEEGQHSIQVFGNDSLGNAYSSGIRYFTVEDSTSPTWILAPVSEPIELIYGMYQDVEATDLSMPITYSISGADGAFFTIHAETGVLTNSTNLSEGSYNINVIATDNATTPNSLITPITIIVQDSYSEYVHLNLGLTQVDLLTEYGLQMNITTNDIAFLDVERTIIDVYGLTNLTDNMNALYFYSFIVYNESLIENEDCIVSITMRLYYDPGSISNPSNLRVLHYTWIEELQSWLWLPVDISVNTDGNYVEFTTDSLSYFCLAVSDVPFIFIPLGDEGSLLLIPVSGLILIIIIGAAVAVAIPTSLYIYKSKNAQKTSISKKKVPLSKKSLDEDFVKRAQLKRRQLNKTWSPKELSQNGDAIITDTKKKSSQRDSEENSALSNPMQDLSKLDNADLVLLSAKFWEKIEFLNLEEQDEQDLIRDLLSLELQEREALLDEMVELKKKSDHTNDEIQS
ncbi:MAG: hypothetical protein BAJALOKI1v1_450012 [Promethearchaeota archaeon]|nr:MAG: hypothetical protein BAJALOKI1v1_450012 [Candidatus Lokiarchaeota archaeon]